MLVNAERLIEASGISCFVADVHASSEHDDAVLTEARLAFVTPNSLSRMERSGIGTSAAAQRVKVEYGDIVMRWKLPSGKPAGRHLRCGLDAAVYIELEGGDGPSALPFTGRSMHRARMSLLSRIDQGRELTQDQSRIFDGISEVFEIIQARPDPRRYGEEMIGQAFFANFTNISKGVSIGEPEDMKAFSRIARHAMLHAQLRGRGKPGSERYHVHEGFEDLIHRLSPQATVSGLLGMFSQKRSAANPIQVHDRPAALLRQLTTVHPDKVDAMQFRAGPGEAVLKALEENRLDGAWIRAARKMAYDQIAGARISIYGIAGRDILAVEDGSSISLFSWPSESRSMLVRDGSRMQIAFSMSEAPEESYLADLAAAIDAGDLPRPVMSTAGAA